ncbi:MAG: hypothetical protein Q7S21_07595 [archaeon]|nr:hypothetical protein [archaeon]
MVSMHAYKMMTIKAIVFFAYGIILGSLFFLCMLQGIILHLHGFIFEAWGYYLLGFLCAAAGIANYLQAKHNQDWASIFSWGN